MNRPKVVAVSASESYQVMLKFDNGEVRIFDVKPYIKGEWYSELNDLSYFRKVRIEGLSISWPNGQDVCPDELYYNSSLYEGTESM